MRPRARTASTRCAAALARLARDLCPVLLLPPVVASSGCAPAAEVGRDAAATVGTDSGAAANRIALRARCLPACIASFWDACPDSAACTSEARGATTAACLASGVRVVQTREADGRVVTLTTLPDGRTGCVRTTRQGDEILYEQLLDGRSARLALVSHEQRTAYCGDDSYADVYPLALCTPLESLTSLACRAGPCAP